MQDAIVLTDILKAQIGWWIACGVVSAPFVINQCLGIWSRFRKSDSASVSRMEFEALRKMCEELREDTISKAEFASIKEDLTEIKQTHRDLSKTLQEISKQLYSSIGAINRSPQFQKR